MSKKYTYFVAYFTAGAVGNAVIKLPAPLDSAARLCALEAKLSPNDKAIITNFVLLRTESQRDENPHEICPNCGRDYFENETIAEDGELRCECQKGQNKDEPE